MFDFLRVSTAVPKLKIGDIEFNTTEIINSINESSAAGSSIIVFPELSITGCTCGDLFYNSHILSSVSNSIERIIEASTKFGIITIVGAPIKIFDSLYDCAIVIGNGKVCGIVPKSYFNAINSGERWFSDVNALNVSEIDSWSIGLNNSDCYDIPVGSIIFDVNGNIKFAVEIGDDLFSPISPASVLSVLGAEVIFNTAALTEGVNKNQKREDLVRLTSQKNICAYCLVSAGAEESTSDYVYSGHSVIAENGKVLAKNTKIADSDYILTTDIDLGKIKADRAKFRSFNKLSLITETPSYVRLESKNLEQTSGELYKISKLPFVPENKDERIARCKDIFQIQVEGLKKRVKQIGCKLVIGISGGLDSTLALLVSAECMKQLGKPMSDVIGITMPCFGTTDRTLKNALELMNKLGVQSKTIPIADACLQHFKDIEHSVDKLDLTYENSQARERTQVLMDYSGEIGGLVVGTGDLSELALGWCTYNGDHMSMYAVNCDIPKTLIRWIIDSLVENGTFANCKSVLSDILDTPISPELLPPDAAGKIAQVTEDLVGPYALHDFFLYYTVRFGFEPKKIYHLAKKAFCNDFDDETIKKWLKVFYRRFFTQQFKRNCVPDGVKVGSVGLSPRGDWSMPSDAVSSLWLKSIDEL